MRLNLLLLYSSFSAEAEKKTKNEQNNKQRNTMRGFNLAAFMFAERL